MIYALWTYHWRAAAIRTGGRGPFDDRFGPVSSLLPHLRVVVLIVLGQTILCAALLGMIFLLKTVQDFPDRQLYRGHHRQLRAEVYHSRSLREDMARASSM